MPSKHSAFGRGARPLACRECGALRGDGVEISARGLCLDCGNARQNMAAVQLNARKGPYYDAWRASVIDHARRLASTV